MAFNLYCNATPSVDDYEDAEEQIEKAKEFIGEIERYLKDKNVL